MAKLLLSWSSKVIELFLKQYKICACHSFYCWNLFFLQDDFCFINGRCVASGTQDGSNSCNYCDVKLNAFDWSLKLGIEGKNKHINDNHLIMTN